MKRQTRIGVLIAAALAIWVTVRGFMEALRSQRAGPRPQRRPVRRPDAAVDAAQEGAPSPERRRLLSLVTIAGAVTGATVVGIPVIGFIVVPPFRKTEQEWQRVGRVEDFPEDGVSQVDFLNAAPLAWSGPASRSASWLWRRGPEDFVAYKVTCTHLGCPVRWEDGAQFFMCPCHGGVFFKDGEVAAGPPRKPLEQYATRVTDGWVEVRSGPVPITGDLLLSD